jgi:hypothetical protein
MPGLARPVYRARHGFYRSTRQCPTNIRTSITSSSSSRSNLIISLSLNVSQSPLLPLPHSRYAIVHRETGGRRGACPARGGCWHAVGRLPATPSATARPHPVPPPSSLCSDRLPFLHVCGGAASIWMQRVMQASGRLAMHASPKRNGTTGPGLGHRHSLGAGTTRHGGKQCPSPTRSLAGHPGPG